ncbi:hypothetical protein DCE93_10080 [Agromyces badenianii]|uniref:Uncharacterized protein n=1 Tax=Agromyces badenianii TaxID=2080742 RepID=A0A2S0WXE0_9MICO|nr:hypothetical protein [Agromyces badenianii]AWB95968.1 hypothetical protein DCE93_10080 [Agromyces badenianii]
MSQREPHTSTEPHAGAVMGMRGCDTAADCRSERPGHRLHTMQTRLVATTASKWVDAVVVEVSPDGFATLAEFSSDSVRRVWHHDAFGGGLAAGDPVAVHAVYGVLALGARHFSVAAA